MFNIGEKVVYSNNGVCLVKDITTLDISTANKDKLYYVLQNIDTEAIAYIPTDSMVFLRLVMEEKEARALIDNIYNIEPFKFPNINTKETQKICQDTINSHNPEKILALIKYLKILEKEKAKQKKKLSSTCERYLSQAIMIISSELSTATNITRKDLEEIIEKSIED